MKGLEKEEEKKEEKDKERDSCVFLYDINPVKIGTPKMFSCNSN